MITYILTKIKGKILGYYLFNINNNIANYLLQISINSYLKYYIYMIKLY